MATEARRCASVADGAKPSVIDRLDAQRLRQRLRAHTDKRSELQVSGAGCRHILAGLSLGEVRLRGCVVRTAISSAPCRTRRLVSSTTVPILPARRGLRPVGADRACPAGYGCVVGDGVYQVAARRRMCPSAALGSSPCRPPRRLCPHSTLRYRCTTSARPAPSTGRPSALPAVAAPSGGSTGT